MFAFSFLSLLYFILLLLLWPHFKPIRTALYITSSTSSNTTSSSCSSGAVTPVSVLTNTHSIVDLRRPTAECNVCLEHKAELCWRDFATGGHFKKKPMTCHDHREQEAARTALNNACIFILRVCKCVFSKDKNCIFSGSSSGWRETCKKKSRFKGTKTTTTTSANKNHHDQQMLYVNPYDAIYTD